MLIDNLEALIIASLAEGLTVKDIRDIVEIILKKNKTSNIREENNAKSI